MELIAMISGNDCIAKRGEGLSLDSSVTTSTPIYSWLQQTVACHSVLTLSAWGNMKGVQQHSSIESESRSSSLRQSLAVLMLRARYLK